MTDETTDAPNAQDDCAVRSTWAVVVWKGKQPNGKNIWSVEREFDEEGEAQSHLERLRAEGFAANLVHFEEEEDQTDG